MDYVFPTRAAAVAGAAAGLDALITLGDTTPAIWAAPATGACWSSPPTPASFRMVGVNGGNFANKP